ncbi:hypothetical protein MRX96_003536 [Rhipicephalus microplus]
MLAGRASIHGRVRKPAGLGAAGLAPPPKRLETQRSVVWETASRGGWRRSDNLGECDYRGGDDYYYFRADPVVRPRKKAAAACEGEMTACKRTRGSLNSATRFLVTRAAPCFLLVVAVVGKERENSSVVSAESFAEGVHNI